MENLDTIKLLQNCEIGVKMAVSSFDEILDKTKESSLIKILSDSKENHLKIQKDIENELKTYNISENEPPIMAKSMSFFKTNIKMMMDNSSSMIASLITDGCNMGIKNLNKYLNEYKDSNDKAKELATKLIYLEEDLCKEIEKYL